jgi:hypothetical protein
MVVVGAGAESCTTQARLSPDVRSALADVATELGDAVKAGDAARIQSMTVAEFAASQQAFAPTAELVHDVSADLGGDSLAVTQLYLLDARDRQAGDTSEADFSCPLVHSIAEADFSIPALPGGLYAFAMVEATGPRPWLLSFLLRKDGGTWKMAGFYPRARTAAGHDGGWYWSAAYAAGKAHQAWLSWLLYGEADQLLRPANFATSTKLDSLRSQRRSFAPPELANGVTPTAPLLLKLADGTTAKLTGVEAHGSDDGQRLELVLHLAGAAQATDDQLKAEAQAAARAFVDAHTEVRGHFDTVVVFASADGREPIVTEQKLPEIP